MQNSAKALCAFLLVFSMGYALPAAAQELADISKPTDFYAGPGFEYDILGTLNPVHGNYVEVIQCQLAWCEVDTKVATSVWVHKDDLLGHRYHATGTTGLSLDFISKHGVGVSVQVTANKEPIYVSSEGTVCFYEFHNYKGSAVCLTAGENRRSLGNWNDRISSVKLSGGATAIICLDENYEGVCVEVNQNYTSFSGDLENNVSSWKIN